MIMSRIRRLTLTIVLVSVGVAVPQSADTAEDEFTATVQRRVRDWQPTQDERLLDQVGWASDLVQAKQLAAKHGRPLFVFTYNGSTTRANAIALQRC